VLVEIVKGDGETVVSGELIARIDTEAKAGAAAPAAAAAPKAAAPAAAAAAPAGTASPSARKILDEKGIAAADVAGSGRGGRVTKEDAVAAAPKAGPVAAPAAAKAALPAPAVEVALGDRTEQRVPMTRLRARIAERLLQSQEPTPS
jgi:2-oxoglutarate dehydrogenase E2 component (dihydrolipoamide succinyltransferase)